MSSKTHRSSLHRRPARRRAGTPTTYVPSEGTRTFLVTMLVEVPEEHDEQSAEYSVTCAVLDTMGEVVAILASHASEVRVLRA